MCALAPRPNASFGNFKQRAADTPELQGVVMKKIVSALGLLIALSLGAIAWSGGSDVQASPEHPKGACAAGVMTLDDGYGVSRQVACVR